MLWIGVVPQSVLLHSVLSVYASCCVAVVDRRLESAGADRRCREVQVAAQQGGVAGSGGGGREQGGRDDRRGVGRR